MGILLIPLLFVVITIYTLNIVFFFKRKNEGHMMSNKIYMIGIIISVLLFVISQSMMARNWHNINMIENAYILFGCVIIIPGLLGIIGVYIPSRFGAVNVIGFSVAFSVILSGILSIPYLILFA